MNRFLFACVLGLCALPSAAHAATTPVTMSIGDARLVEPPSGQKSMIFPVTLSGVWDDDVRVSYATSTGPNAGSADSTTLATPGFDFASRQGVLTIPTGETHGQIEVPVLADTQIEKDETFIVTLSDIQGYDNSGLTVTLNRSVAKGTIVEPVKGVALGGLVATYEVSPSSYTYDPTTGQYVDTFDTPAQQVVQSNVTVTVTGTNFTGTATTNSQGKFTILVRPGTYSVKVNDFSLLDYDNNAQTYSVPARTVSLSRDSTANNFYFYGVAGTVGVPSSSSSTIYGAYVTVSARPVGAASTSTPTATAIADYYDSAKKSRGYRFFIPALPPGRYTLTITDVDGYGYNYTTYYNFPTVTVTVPTSVGVNRPDAHVEIVGTPKPFSNSTRSTKSSSVHSS